MRSVVQTDVWISAFKKEQLREERNAETKFQRTETQVN
jgi:ornithine carbamoyltransferase